MQRIALLGAVHGSPPVQSPGMCQHRQSPHQSRPFGPCFSHSVSCFHVASETTRPVHVRGVSPKSQAVP
jgi:hypothetical protein